MFPSSRSARGRALTVALVAAVMAAAGVLSQVVVSQAASADTVLCDQFASTQIQHGRYVVQNNRWGSSATQCINVTGAGFSITQQDGVKPTNGAPNSYPSVYYGCHYGNCSSGTILPLQASSGAFAAIRTTVSMKFPSAGIWDAAYDIWFDPTPRTDGQNTGAEVMVWLNHQGGIQPVGAPVGTVALAGGTWTVWEGNIGWNVVSYVRTSPTGTASFPVSAFFDDAVQRGFAQTSWYLTSIQAGFEPWQSGVGLTVNGFAVTTSGGAATGGSVAPGTAGSAAATPSTAASGTGTTPAPAAVPHGGPNCPVN
jgi:hypothetical protein